MGGGESAFDAAMAMMEEIEAAEPEKPDPFVLVKPEIVVTLPSVECEPGGPIRMMELPPIVLATAEYEAHPPIIEVVPEIVVDDLDETEPDPVERALIRASRARTPEDMRGLPVFGQITKKRPWAGQLLSNHRVQDDPAGAIPGEKK